MITVPGYRILSTLGQGGMATVYLAVQESVDREVAIKVLSPYLLTDPSFGERFLREARIAAKLHHRHIVSVYDVGVAGDVHYAAMEVLGGGTIMDSRDAPVPIRESLRCVREVAMALDYAHGKRYIHRDVKPDNILSREDGSYVLCDFGIARAFTSATQMTRTGAVVGTPFYMSPEQLRGQPLDGRSDLYSLGVVLYHLLTGDVPYRASDSLAVGILHMTAPLPLLPPHVRALQPVIERLLAKDPADRYQTGAELARQIADIERLDRFDRDALGEAMTDKMPLSTRRAVPVVDGAVRPKPAAAKPLRATDTPIEVSAAASGRREPTMHFEAAGSTDPHALRAEPRRSTAKPAPSSGGTGRTIFALLALSAVAAGGYFSQPYWPALKALWRPAEGPTDSALSTAKQYADTGTLIAADAQDALAYAAKARTLSPTDADVLQFWRDLRARLLQQLRANPALARDWGARLNSAFPNDADVAQALVAARPTLPNAQPPTSAPAPAAPAPPEPIARDWIAEANTAISADRWFGSNDAALDLLLEAWTESAQPDLAQPLIVQAVERLQQRVNTLIRDGNYGDAEQLLARYADKAPVADDVAFLAARLGGAQQLAADEIKVDALLAEAASAEQRGQLTSPAANNALTLYRQVLELNPQNSRARAGLQRIAEQLIQDAQRAVRGEQYTMAERLLSQARQIDPAIDGAAELDRAIAQGKAPPVMVDVRSPEQTAALQQALESARTQLRAGALSEPPGDSAFDYLRAAQSIDRRDNGVLALRDDLSAALAQRVADVALRDRFEEAVVTLETMKAIAGNNDSFLGARNTLSELLIDRTRLALSRNDFSDTQTYVKLLKRTHPTHPELNALQREMDAL